MGKMKEIFTLLEKRDKEGLEGFFKDRGFNGATSTIAVKEFEKAYSELNNIKKGESNNEK